MGTVNERLHILRTELLNMTMENFGKKIGVSKATISNIENGYNMSSLICKAICSEYHVNYFWLMKGEGEPFVDFPETALDELCFEYELDDFEKSIIFEFVKLTKEKRAVIVEYIKSIKKEL